MRTFLNRFEEAVNSAARASSPRSLAGSNTGQEDGASRTTVLAGTRTLTEVRREAGDKDRAAQVVLAFPGETVN